MLRCVTEDSKAQPKPDELTDRVKLLRQVAAKLDVRARRKGIAATVNLALVGVVLAVGIWMIFDTAKLVAETTKAELISNAARVRLEQDFTNQMQLQEQTVTTEKDGRKTENTFQFAVDPSKASSPEQKRLSAGALTTSFFPWSSAQIAAGRLVALMLLVFLITLLAGIYRYNTRLQEFYATRARIIELAEADESIDIRELLALLLVESVEVDRMPKIGLLDLLKARHPDSPPAGKASV